VLREPLPAAVAAPPVDQLAGDASRARAALGRPAGEALPDRVDEGKAVGALVLGEALERRVTIDAPVVHLVARLETSAGCRPALRSGGWPERRNQYSAGGSNGELRIGVSTSNDMLDGAPLVQPAAG
jgi:hypothetical protein